MNDKEKKPNPWTKSLLIWAGVLFALVVFVQLIDGGSRTQTGQAMAYSDFVRQVQNGNVRSVTIATSSTGNSAIAGKLNSGEDFHTIAPSDGQVSEKLIQKGVDQVAKFSWKVAAEKVVETYQLVGGSQRRMAAAI